MTRPRPRSTRPRPQRTALLVEILGAVAGLLLLAGGFRAVHDGHVHRSGDGEVLQHRHAWVGPHEHGPETHEHDVRSSGGSREAAGSTAGAVPAPPARKASDGHSRVGFREGIPGDSATLFVALGSSPVPTGEAPTGEPDERPPGASRALAADLPSSLAAPAVRARGPPAARAA